MSRVGALANTVSQHTFQTTVRVLKQGHALAMWIPGVAPFLPTASLPQHTPHSHALHLLPLFGVGLFNFSLIFCCLWLGKT